MLSFIFAYCKKIGFKYPLICTHKVKIAIFYQFLYNTTRLCEGGLLNRNGTICKCSKLRHGMQKIGVLTNAKINVSIAVATMPKGLFPSCFAARITHKDYKVKALKLHLFCFGPRKLKRIK
jgi:hypothetical protein